MYSERKRRGNGEMSHFTTTPGQGISFFPVTNTPRWVGTLVPSKSPAGSVSSLSDCLFRSPKAGHKLCFPAPLRLRSSGASPGCPLPVSTWSLAFVGNEHKNEWLRIWVWASDRSRHPSRTATSAYLIPLGVAQPHRPHLNIWTDNNYAHLVGLLRDWWEDAWYEP